MLPKDRFTKSVITKDRFDSRLQFNQITGNNGKHQEPYFHGLFTAFSLTFHGLFTCIIISCNFIKIAQFHKG